MKYIALFLKILLAPITDINHCRSNCCKGSCECVRDQNVDVDVDVDEITTDDVNADADVNVDDIMKEVWV